MKARRAHRSGTFVLSLAMLVIGIGLVVETITGAGGPLSGRLLLGVLFIAAGLGRGYIEIRRGPRSPR